MVTIGEQPLVKSCYYQRVAIITGWLLLQGGSSVLESGYHKRATLALEGSYYKRMVLVLEDGSGIGGWLLLEGGNHKNL